MTQEIRLGMAGCVFRPLSPVTFVVLSSLQGGHAVDYCFLASSSQLCSASPGEVQHLLQSPSSGSLSSVETWCAHLKKKINAWLSLLQCYYAIYNPNPEVCIHGYAKVWRVHFSSAFSPILHKWSGGRLRLGARVGKMILKRTSSQPRA